RSAEVRVADVDQPTRDATPNRARLPQQKELSSQPNSALSSSRRFGEKDTSIGQILGLQRSAGNRAVAARMGRFARQRSADMRDSGHGRVSAYDASVTRESEDEVPSNAAVQRQESFSEPRPISVRSPAVEEAVTQFTDAQAAAAGRHLS